MGRVRRQRRYKACDPFSKEQMKGNYRNNQDCDLAPKKKDIDEYFSESKNLLRFKEQVEKAKQKKAKRRKNFEEQQTICSEVKVTKRTHSVKEALSKSLPKQPKESTKQYFQRLNENIQNAANEAMKDDKKIRKKRKQHLKARDQKKKAKQTLKVEEVKDFNTFQDQISFGEVAQQPPSIKAKPRKVPINQNSNLHLLSYLQNTDPRIKRKQMTEVEIADHDRQRQQAIDAYRLLKKRKEIQRDQT